MIADRFEGVRPRGKGFIARCPAHEDRKASLTIGTGDDGKTLLHCHAGCTVEAIASAAGLQLGDLFPEKTQTRPRIVATYDYRDERGELLFQVLRREDKSFPQRRPDGAGGWIWKLGDTRRVLYRLPELLAADPEATVFIAEGEKDVENLVARGFVATTNPGGAEKWRAELGAALAGRDVVILPDNDDVGRRHANNVAARLVGVARSVKVVELPRLPPKGDVSDWLERGGEPIVLRALAHDAPEWSPGAAKVPLTSDGGEELDGGRSEPRQRRSRPVSSLVSEIVEFGKQPRLSWAVPELDRLAPFVVGGAVVVIGATGRGKSSFVLHVGSNHARTIGPVLIVSAELAGAVVGARLVSRAHNVSWLAPLSGEVSAEVMSAALDIPNMRILDNVGPDILEVIDDELAVFAEEYPGQPALVLLDYLQLLPGVPEIRQRVTDNMVGVRKLVEKHRAGAVVIAKAGRAAARGLRGGETVGADATEAGAETNAIEHETIAQITLGMMRPADEADPEGPQIIDVSITKCRFGVSDKVIPLWADLKAGRFEPHGAAVSAAERKAAVKVRKTSASVETVVRAVRDLYRTSDKPLSRAEAKAMIKGDGNVFQDAIIVLTSGETPELVAVSGPDVKKKGGFWPLWMPERAIEAGLTIVPPVVIEHG